MHSCLHFFFLITLLLIAVHKKDVKSFSLSTTRPTAISICIFLKQQKQRPCQLSHKRNYYHDLNIHSNQHYNSKENNEIESNEDDNVENKSQSSKKNKQTNTNKTRNRRSFLVQYSSSLLFTATVSPQVSNAATTQSLFFKAPKASSALGPIREDSSVGLQVRSIEEALLNILPVKNKLFRRLQKLVQALSFTDEAEAWETATTTALSILDLVDSKRSQLEPAFNENDATILVLTKAELGEVFIEEFRNTVLALVNATQSQNITAVTLAKTQAALALSEVGELLVEKYPYDIPKEGKFSYLPRLLGRTRVTFLIKRPGLRGPEGEIIGNITIIADGFAAPITAGNFVDLSMRGFYTGLPVKTMKKRLGLSPENEESVIASSPAAKLGSVLKIPDYYEIPPATSSVDDSITQITVPVLGSFQEGFYDPLTAKPRRIPVEVLRTDRKTGDLTMSWWPFDPSYPSSLENDQKNKPVITFDGVPGIVALNHPDRLFNLASSEFFALPRKQVEQGNLGLLTGQYSAFGYIINDGMQVLDNLLPGDVISETIVSETGLMYLVKIRQASFPDLFEGDD